MSALTPSEQEAMERANTALTGRGVAPNDSLVAHGFLKGWLAARDYYQSLSVRGHRWEPSESLAGGWETCRRCGHSKDAHEGYVDA